MFCSTAFAGKAPTPARAASERSLAVVEARARELAAQYQIAGAGFAPRSSKARASRPCATCCSPRLSATTLQPSMMRASSRARAAASPKAASASSSRPSRSSAKPRLCSAAGLAPGAPAACLKLGRGLVPAALPQRR